MPYMTAPSRIAALTTIFATVLLLIKLASNSFFLPMNRLTNSLGSLGASQPHYHGANSRITCPNVHISLHDRLAHAERLWHQSTQDRQTMLAEVGVHKRFPDGYIYPYNIWDFARPSFFCPHDLERVGTLGDGGKVVCGMSQYENISPGPSSASNNAPELIVYSFGVSDDSSFEASLLERTNAKIWGYDFSVESWSEEIRGDQYNRAYFMKAGIGRSDDNANPPMYTVQDVMRMNGHSYVDIIKMDIEGAEFDALTSLIHFIQSEDSHGNMPFGQLLLEIHFMRDPKGFSIPKTLRSWVDWWESLEQMGLRPVNNEGNWIGDAQFGRPRFMEVRFLFA